jgi:CheY-like chemotaxis protein
MNNWRGSCVLLVDHHVDERDMYAQYLWMQGFVALQADNVQDGFRIAEQLRPDVIITGMTLQTLDDGLAFTRRLKASADTGPTPVIVLSGYVREADRRDAEAAGCDQFLTKPCVPELLADSVGRVLTRSRVGA